DENGAPYTENVIYDPQTCRITDYIDDGKNPKITIDFNPCLVASKNTYEVWTGWTYTDYYDTDNDGGVDKTKVMPATHGNKQGFMYIFDDKWQGGSNPLRNTHIDFYIVYAEGYNEVLFDAGYAFIPDYPDNTKTRKMEITSGGVIVDSNRRFAVMAIKDDQTYKDALNYIPTAKYVAGDVLYCSVGWKHEGHDHLIDCESWNEDLTYESKEHVGDSVIYAYYCYYDSDNNKNNLSNGYLTTYYANNKYAHMGNVNGVVGAYNNAYFDPETNIGGTMHYIYYIPTVNGVYEEYNAATHGANDYIVYNGKKYPVKCEPLFAYDPDEDYLNAYKFPGAPGDDVKNVDEYYHAIYKCDFNIRSYAEYLFEKGTVIAKEPKRYTVYVGEGMHFTFPTVVCDPEGVFVDEPVYKPENSNKITVNGNTFYTSLGNSNFTLSRNDKGWATMFIYTEATTPVTYGTGLNLGLLPYTNYESTTEVSSMHNYNTCFPYGSHGVYFHAPYTQVVVGKDENDNEITEKYKAFTDFNTNSYNSEYTVYGSGLKLTYPDKSVYKVDGFNGEQYAYYQQWEYALKFNANCDKELLTNEGYDESNVVYNTIRPLNVGADDPIHIYGNDLYTRDDYIVAYWCTKPNGVGTKYTDGMTVNNNVGVIFDVDTMFTSSCDAMMSFCEAGITLYAYWVRTVDFTLHKSGTSPTANFAKVTYYHPVADKQMDEVEVSQTQVFKCKPGTVVTVEIIDAPAASQYEFSYFTWNIPYRDTVGDSGINLNKKPDRILTNRMTYSFTILSHSAMTARFVSRGSTTPFYIDRNNKLLRAPENNVPDSWLLYSDTSTPRAWYGVTSAPTSSDPSASNQPLSGENYYTYKSNTRYSIKVSGSTYSAMNTTHTKLYDDVLTLMTDAVNGTNRFVGWQLGNKYISYEPIYKYRVTGNAEITAVYSSTSVTDTGYVTLTSDGTDAYILTRHAPEGYTLLESGFLLTTDSTETDFEELLYQKSVYRITTTDTNKDGSFRLKLKEKSYYGYGYAIYKYMDGGVEKTVEYTVPLTQ
ncbi:MAG: hypothetical protein IKU19_08970, partial [Clostridia bacterium]|nr:hypothetical protein [Clostridia bacterium]